jgi:hypothetical protein
MRKGQLLISEEQEGEPDVTFEEIGMRHLIHGLGFFTVSLKFTFQPRK